MPEIQLHNTLSGKVEPFVPQKPGEVRMYSCGPTVYDYAHIGNYRTFVFQDILRRFLKLRGFPERWRLYQAVSPLRAVRASERSPFVGREAELMELRRLMGQGDFAKGQPDSDGCLRGGVGAASRSQVCRNSRQ